MTDKPHIIHVLSIYFLSRIYAYVLHVFYMLLEHRHTLRRLTKHGTFTESTELRKIPISTEMSVVLLTKHGTFDIS